MYNLVTASSKIQCKGEVPTHLGFCACDELINITPVHKLTLLSSWASNTSDFIVILSVDNTTRKGSQRSFVGVIVEPIKYSLMFFNIFSVQHVYSTK